MANCFSRCPRWNDDGHRVSGFGRDLRQKGVEACQEYMPVEVSGGAAAKRQQS